MMRDDIVNKQFSRAFLGYDAQEVDAFLDELIREIETLEQELAVSQMRSRLLAEEIIKRNGKKRTDPAKDSVVPETDKHTDEIVNDSDNIDNSDNTENSDDLDNLEKVYGKKESKIKRDNVISEDDSKTYSTLFHDAPAKK